MNRRSLFRSLLGAVAGVFTSSLPAFSKPSIHPNVGRRLRQIYGLEIHPLDELIPGNEDGFTYRELATYTDCLYRGELERQFGPESLPYCESATFRKAIDLQTAARRRECGKKVRDAEEELKRLAREVHAREAPERERQQRAAILEKYREELKSVVDTGREGQELANLRYAYALEMHAILKQSKEHFGEQTRREAMIALHIGDGDWHLNPAGYICTCRNDKHDCPRF